MELSISLERPGHGEILLAICDRFEVDPTQAAGWLAQFDPVAAQREVAEMLGIATARIEASIEARDLLVDYLRKNGEL